MSAISSNDDPKDAGDSQDVAVVHSPRRVAAQPGVKVLSEDLQIIGSRKGVTKRVPTVTKVKRLALAGEEATDKAFCNSSDNVRGYSYETWQKVYRVDTKLTMSDSDFVTSELAIHFICRRKTPAPCTERFSSELEVTCKADSRK